MAAADTLPPPKAAKPPDRGPAASAIRAIDPRLLYPAPDFRRQLRFGDFTWRKLKRQGLRVLSIDRKEFVLGQDFIDFLLTRHTNGKEAV